MTLDELKEKESEKEMIIIIWERVQMKIISRVVSRS